MFKNIHKAKLNLYKWLSGFHSHRCVLPDLAIGCQLVKLNDQTWTILVLKTKSSLASLGLQSRVFFNVQKKSKIL